MSKALQIQYRFQQLSFGVTDDFIIAIFRVMYLNTTRSRLIVRLRSSCTLPSPPLGINYVQRRHNRSRPVERVPGHATIQVCKNYIIILIMNARMRLCVWGVHLLAAVNYGLFPLWSLLLLLALFCKKQNVQKKTIKVLLFSFVRDNRWKSPLCNYCETAYVCTHPRVHKCAGTRLCAYDIVQRIRYGKRARARIFDYYLCIVLLHLLEITKLQL